MSTRGVRRWVSCVAIAAVVFGQLAMAVHACPVQQATQVVPAAHAGTHGGGPPCADSGGAPAGTQGVGCESHCSNGIVGAVQPDIPAAAFTALPAPALAVAGLGSSDACLGAALLPVSRAPPLTLQFCRLLI